MMRRIILIISLVLVFSGLGIYPVDAHVLKTDGSIGAILHVSPDDDPIAGEQSSFYFEFKDKDNKFAPQNCTCIFHISENGKEIDSQNLFARNSDPSLSNASVNFTFPQKDIYIVRVEGRPKMGMSFQPFSLTYTIRVARDSTSVHSENTASLTYFIIGGLVVFFIGIFIIKKIVKGGEKDEKNSN